MINANALTRRGHGWLAPVTAASAARPVISDVTTTVVMSFTAKCRAVAACSPIATDNRATIGSSCDCRRVAADYV